MSRVYITIEDKEVSKKYFKKLQKLWEGRDILLVEGEKSRLGVGNDLFCSANSIVRILAPMHNAFDVYNRLLNEVKKYSKTYLVLIALGPTATVLAYDLALLNYQAIDIGNVDIEYEWFKRGATKKVKIPGKYTSEAKDGRLVNDIEHVEYKNQIDNIIFE